MPTDQTDHVVSLQADSNIAMLFRPVAANGRYMSKKEANASAAAERVRVNRVQPVYQARLCAEGDSWINILWPLSAAAGYEPTFFDILEESYYAASVAYPGDTFAHMRAERDYYSLVSSESFDFFIFSGGGNDFLGGGALANLLKDRKASKGSKPANFVDRTRLTAAFDMLESGYRDIATDIKSLTPRKKTRMLVHGYDVPIPRENGKWIGTPFQNRGYNLTSDATLIHGILSLMIDEFYQRLAKVAARHKNVTVVDLRGKVGHWHDELHPNTQGSKSVAQEFMRVIEGG